MSADLDQLTLVADHNPVCPTHGRQPVSNNDHRTPLTSSAQVRSRPRLPYRGRDSTSPRRARVPPGQRAQLAQEIRVGVTRRQPRSVAHHSVEPVGHLFETVSGANAVEGFPQFVFRCRRLGKPKVVGDRSVKQEAPLFGAPPQSCAQ